MTEPDFQMLARARLEKVEALVMPPGHPPVFGYLVSIWADGLTAGMQMDGGGGSAPSAEQQLTASLPESLYRVLESPAALSQYAEFPELTDRDFEDLAIDRVHKLIRQVQPRSHPEVSAMAAEIWIDGVATALRLTRAGDAHLARV